MNQTCLKCGSQGPGDARFCQGCGQMHGATTLSERTMVATAPAVVTASPEVEIQALVQRARAAFGDGVVGVGTLSELGGDPNQREHTVVAEDISASMESPYDGRRTKLEAAKRATVTMIVNKAKIDPGDEVGIVAFDDSPYRILELCPLGSHKPRIIEAVQSLSIQGGTDINEGIKAARDLFDWNRTDVVRRIILLTDGQGGHPLGTADDLKSRGVVIDVIGVGESPTGVDEKLLRKVASVVQGETRYQFIKDQQTLVAHYTRLAGKTATGITRKPQ